MAEWIDHAAHTPTVRFLDKMGFTGTFGNVLRKRRVGVRHP
jgi:hypothetical protein